MPGHTHHSINLNKQCLSVYLQAKNQPHPSYFTWDIVKILQTRYFGFFGHAWLRTPKLILSTCRKLLCLSAGKKKSSPTFFCKHYKDIQISYFGWFGHAWLCKPTIVLSPCRKLQCLSACQKWTSPFISLLRYYILKNPAIWLANSISVHNLRTNILPKMELDHFQEKLMTKFFKNSKKKQPILVQFWVLFHKFRQKWIFLEKRVLSVFEYSYYLPLYKKTTKN